MITQGRGLKKLPNFYQIFMFQFFVHTRRKCNTSQKILKINIFPLFSEFYDKLGKFDKERESGRQHIQSNWETPNQIGTVRISEV